MKKPTKRITIFLTILARFCTNSSIFEIRNDELEASNHKDSQNRTKEFQKDSKTQSSNFGEGPYLNRSSHLFKCTGGIDYLQPQTTANSSSKGTPYQKHQYLKAFVEGPCNSVIIIPPEYGILVARVDCQAMMKNSQRFMSFCGWNACQPFNSSHNGTNSTKNHNKTLKSDCKIPDSEYLLWDEGIQKLIENQKDRIKAGKCLVGFLTAGLGFPLGFFTQDPSDYGVGYISGIDIFPYGVYNEYKEFNGGRGEQDSCGFGGFRDSAKSKKQPLNSTGNWVWDFFSRLRGNRTNHSNHTNHTTNNNTNPTSNFDPFFEKFGMSLKDLQTGFEQQGWLTGLTLQIFPYDWRLYSNMMNLALEFPPYPEADFRNHSQRRESNETISESFVKQLRGFSTHALRNMITRIYNITNKKAVVIGLMDGNMRLMHAFEDLVQCEGFKKSRKMIQNFEFFSFEKNQEKKGPGGKETVIECRENRKGPEKTSIQGQVARIIAVSPPFLGQVSVMNLLLSKTLTPRQSALSKHLSLNEVELANLLTYFPSTYEKLPKKIMQYEASERWLQDMLSRISNERNRINVTSSQLMSIFPNWVNDCFSASYVNSRSSECFTGLYYTGPLGLIQKMELNVDTLRDVLLVKSFNVYAQNFSMSFYSVFHQVYTNPGVQINVIYNSMASTPSKIFYQKNPNSALSRNLTFERFGMEYELGDGSTTTTTSSIANAIKWASEYPATRLNSTKGNSDDKTPKIGYQETFPVNFIDYCSSYQQRRSVFPSSTNFQIKENSYFGLDCWCKGNRFTPANLSKCSPDSFLNDPNLIDFLVTSSMDGVAGRLDLSYYVRTKEYIENYVDSCRLIYYSYFPDFENGGDNFGKRIRKGRCVDRINGRRESCGNGPRTSSSGVDCISKKIGFWLGPDACEKNCCLHGDLDQIFVKRFGPDASCFCAQPSN